MSKNFTRTIQENKKPTNINGLKIGTVLALLVATQTRSNALLKGTIMKMIKKTLLASAILMGVSTANAGVVQVDFDGSGQTTSFDELDVGRFEANSYYVDMDGDGIIENGDIVFDNANNVLVDEYFFGVDDFNFTGGNLELNYVVAGFAQIDDQTGTLLNPNFSLGIFNLFTLDQNGDRTGLAVSFSMDRYELEINFDNSGTSIDDAEIEFFGKAVEAGSEQSVGGFSDQWGVSFQDLIAGGTPPTFFAQLDFLRPQEAITNVADLESTGKKVGQIWGPEVNNHPADCNFGGCSTFIFQDNEFSTGSDSLWEAIRGTFRDGNENLNVYTRSTTLDTEEITIDANAPTSLGIFGAGLLALAGFRRRKA